MSSIPTGRVLDRLDRCLAEKDYNGAERHLAYWVSEAEALHDDRGRLALLNEQIGLFRKSEQKEKGLAAAEAALTLVSALGLDTSVPGATTLLNAATAFKAFGDAGRALPLYERARGIYETQLPPADGRLGGLYNNMALTMAELGRFSEARSLFEAALEVMAKTEHGEAEMAITCCNLADLAAAEQGSLAAETEISAFLDRAWAFLNTADLPHDSGYAYVCEKCAPGFGYYGFFLAEKELMKRAEEIYERA